MPGFGSKACNSACGKICLNAYELCPTFAPISRANLTVLCVDSAIINKYGVDKVAKANQVEELYNQQVKDGKEEFIA